jgi:hypothetical protein
MLFVGLTGCCYPSSCSAKLVDSALASGKIYDGEGFNYIKESFENGTLHLIGLLSDGGVHSRLDQVQVGLLSVIFYPTLCHKLMSLKVLCCHSFPCRVSKLFNLFFLLCAVTSERCQREGSKKNSCAHPYRWA